MKRTILIIVSCFFSFHSMAQRIALSDGVSIILPTEAVKLNKEQIVDFADKNHFIRAAMPPDPKNIYRLNNMLLQFYDSKNESNKNNLMDQKAAMDDIFKRHSNHISYVKKFANYQVHISKIINSQNINYMFYSINDKFSWNLRGIIECDKVDEKSADILLDNILQSIKFKD